jgi:hypothetical protein
MVVSSIRHVPVQTSYRDNLEGLDKYSAKRIKEKDENCDSIVYLDKAAELLSKNDFKQTLDLIEESLGRKVEYPDPTSLPIYEGSLWRISPNLKIFQKDNRQTYVEYALDSYAGKLRQSIFDLKTLGYLNGFGIKPLFPSTP